MGGYLLFARDFAGKDAAAVGKMLNDYRQAGKIPLMLAVDEEGGAVARVSANPLLRDERFPSPRELFRTGGLDAIRADAEEKAALLISLGLNMNLAPVCDMTDDPSAYIYPRTLGRGTEDTCRYVQTVIETFHSAGLSGALKHFPGYGGNGDTHAGQSVDPRTWEELERKDLLPFLAGIRAGADAVLVSHNVITALDDALPASLSPAVHQKLRDMGFTGLILTDELSMGAVDLYDGRRPAAVQAVLAGNDVILLTDYARGYDDLLAALADGTLPRETLDRAAFRVLAWKLTRGLL